MQQQQLPAVAHPDPPLDRSDAAASSATQALPSRNASSKYDFVKVKVWLGENADHYYVLSRFLLSRMLTVTKRSNAAKEREEATAEHNKETPAEQ
nr:unnamed protein product [Digitaria exilis]